MDVSCLSPELAEGLGKGRMKKFENFFILPFHRGNR
jgi:hypothetical protein